MSINTRIQTPTSSLAEHYPDARKFQDLQQKGFWHANEINLEKDVQPIRTEVSESAKHGILTVLKLFTLYELRADEFWSTEVRRMFPRPEIQEMAALFGAMELSVHRRVYDKLNQLLFISNDDFYSSYKANAAMNERMNYLDGILGDPNVSDAIKIATFSFTEGVVLFSSFAFLMSFRANGQNVLPNIGLAVKFSARDEDLHCQASTWLFRTLMQESNYSAEDSEDIKQEVLKVAEKVREHEYEIIKEIFSKGSITGITERQMQIFVDSRVDMVLSRLGYEKVHKHSYNPVADWFDKIVQAYQYTDFFAGAGSSYSRGWNEKGFTWSKAV